MDINHLESLIIHGNMAFGAQNWSHEIKEQKIGK